MKLTPSDDVHAAMDRHDEGTRFCFSAGNYRISTPLEPEEGDELIGAEGAVLNGARVVSGWQSSQGRWTASLPHTTASITPWSGSSLLHPQAVYQEDLFMTGVELWKVGVRHEGRVVGKGPETVGAGEYFIDYDNQVAHIGSDPTGRTVELSTASSVIDSNEDDITVSNLVLEHAAGAGIESEGGEGWTITNNEIRFNHTRGVKPYGGALVAGNFIHHNGMYGLAGSGDGNVFENNEVAFNNAARFARADEEFWDAGGSKFVRNTNLVIRNNYVHDNYGDGIWVDIDNTNVTISGNRVERNYRIGINYEISFAGSIDGNTVTENGWVGIWVNSSRDVTVTSNLVSKNDDAIAVVDQDRSGHPLANVSVTGNTIVDSGVTGTRDTKAATFSGNTYKVRSLQSELWQWDSELVSAAEWKALGMDRTGIFTSL